MRIGMLGTGTVGRTLGGALVGCGHEVCLGSRTADNPQARSWTEETGEGASHGTFGDAVAVSEVVVNATPGAVSLEALASVAPVDLHDKVLLDLSNPIDRTSGFPPRLAVCNDDSLAERIQQAHPAARVVKSLNTVNVAVMIDPAAVPGEHVLFIGGDDQPAKQTVTSLLGDLGWPPERVLDLGDLSSARAMEMYLPLWLRLLGVLGNSQFNVILARGSD